jgi:hypothetical protein
MFERIGVLDGVEHKPVPAAIELRTFFERMDWISTRH